MIAFFGAEDYATVSRTRRTQYHYQVLLSPSGCNQAIMVELDTFISLGKKVDSGDFLGGVSA